MTDFKVCSSCKERNNPAFSECWKCGASFLVKETQEGFLRIEKIVNQNDIVIPINADDSQRKRVSIENTQNDNAILEEHRQIAIASKKKAEILNNWGIAAVLLMLIPGIHYIGLVIIFFIAANMLDEYKKSEYSRGYMDGFEHAQIEIQKQRKGNDWI